MSFFSFLSFLSFFLSNLYQFRPLADLLHSPGAAIDSFSHGSYGPYSCPSENGFDENLYPLPDGVQEMLNKKSVPRDVLGNCIGAAESMNQHYHTVESNQTGEVTNDMIKSFCLDHDFVSIAPSGYSIKRAGNYGHGAPLLERVSPLLASDKFDQAKNYTSSTLSMYQLNANCSELTKRRFDSYCCQHRQQLGALSGSRPGPGFPFQCPANDSVHNVLSSTRNLYKKDASGYFHRWIFLLSFFTGKDNQLLRKSAMDLSRKESTQRVNVENVSAMRPHSVEMGVWWPAGADQMSLELDRATKVAQLGTNQYLHGSKVFQDELSRIAKCEHRVQPPLPTPSQVLNISRYCFTQIKRDFWPDISRETHDRLKIYDARFVWKMDSSISIGSQNGLPPMETLSNFLADHFDIFDIVGVANEERERNRYLIEKLSAKCQFECYNALHTPVDDFLQSERFRVQDERKNAEFAEMNEPTKPFFRASDEANCLTTIEYDLKPTNATMREFRRQGAANRCNTAYRGEIDRGGFWPTLWSSQFGDNCTEESKVSMNLCQSNVPQDYSIYPNKIINYCRRDFATTTAPTTLKSKSVKNHSPSRLIFFLFLRVCISFLVADTRLYTLPCRSVRPKYF